MTTAIKRSHEDIFEFITTASQWLANNPKETKFHYALSRVLRRGMKINSDYKERLDEINIEHCSVDERGNILKDERGEYMFTKDELKKRNQERATLFRKEVEIEPYYAKPDHIPTNLSLVEREIFTGFVIRPEPVEEAAQAEAG